MSGTTSTTVGSLLLAQYKSFRGIALAASQIAAGGALFAPGTPRFVVMAASVALFLTSAALAVHYFRASRLHATQDTSTLPGREARAEKALAGVFAIAALVSLAPLSWRLYREQSGYLPPAETPWPSPLGFLDRTIPSASAAEPQPEPFAIDMQLDLVRCSLRCEAGRSGVGEPDKVDVSSCVRFQLPDEAVGRILYGHQMDQLKFERMYFTKYMKPVRRALQKVQALRGQKEPALEPMDVVYHLSRDSEGKKRLVPLLPRYAEWKALERESPEDALTLRNFVRDFVGYIDPLFRVRFTNRSARPITIRAVRYTVKEQTIWKAVLHPPEEAATYLLELRKGKPFTETMQPGISLGVSASQEVGLLLRLKEQEPGLQTRIDLSFQDDQGTWVAAPPFEVTFWRGKE